MKNFMLRIKATRLLLMLLFLNLGGVISDAEIKAQSTKTLYENNTGLWINWGTEVVSSAELSNLSVGDILKITVIALEDKEKDCVFKLKYYDSSIYADVFLLNVECNKNGNSFETINEEIPLNDISIINKIKESGLKIDNTYNVKIKIELISPPRVDISDTSLSLMVGEKYDGQNYKVLTSSPKNITDPSACQWSFSPDTYDCITTETDGSNLKITPKKAGSVTVTATYTYGGGVSKSASCVVDVTEPTFNINKTYSTLLQGRTEALGYEIEPALSTLPGLSVSWESGNTEVATVTEGGVVTAVGAGTTNINATLKNGTDVVATKSCIIIVYGTPTLSVEDKTVQRTETGTLTATITPQAIPGKSIVWSLADAASEEIVQLSSGGSFKALKAGEAHIKATYQYWDEETDVTEATCTLTVTKKPEMALENKEVTLKKGGTATLTYLLTDLEESEITSKSWEVVEGTGIVSVSDGVVSQVGYGTATIKLTVNYADGSLEDTYNIITIKPTITFKRNEITLAPGYSTSLHAIIDPDDQGLAVVWSITGSSKITINPSTGEITTDADALGENATVTATYSENGETIASATINVHCKDVKMFGSNGSFYTIGSSREVVIFNIASPGDFGALVNINNEVFSSWDSSLPSEDVSIFRDHAKIIRFVAYELGEADVQKLIGFVSTDAQEDFKRYFDFTEVKNLNYNMKLPRGEYNANDNSNHYRGCIIISQSNFYPETTYNKFVETKGWSENLAAVANYYSCSDANPELLNTFEIYVPAGKKPVTMFEYNGIKSVTIGADEIPNLDITSVVIWGKGDNVKDWIESIDKDLVKYGHTDVNFFDVRETIINGELTLTNPNLKEVDLTGITAPGGGCVSKVDLTRCTNLEVARFVDAKINTIDASGLTKLEVLNLTGVHTGESTVSGVTKPTFEGLNVYVTGSGTATRYTYDNPTVETGKTRVDGLLVSPEFTEYTEDDVIPTDKITGDYSAGYCKGRAYVMDGNTLDITLRIKSALTWGKYGKITSLRQFTRSIKKEIAHLYTDKEQIGEDADISADHINLNTVKIIGPLRPRNMAAFNDYSTDLDIVGKYEQGDIVCKFLDLTEAFPVKNDAPATVVSTDTDQAITWGELFTGVNTKYIDFVTMPTTTNTDFITATNFANFTSLKAAGMMAEIGTTGKYELTAYVKEPGSLNDLSGYLSYHVLRDNNGRGLCSLPDHSSYYKHYMYNAWLTKVDNITLRGTLNALDLCNSNVGEWRLTDGHIVLDEAGELVGELVHGGLHGVNTMKVLDLSGAVVPNTIDFTLSKIGTIGSSCERIWLPASPEMTELPDDFLNVANETIKEICIPYNFKTIGRRAFAGLTTLYHVFTTDQEGDIIDKAGIYSGKYTNMLQDITKSSEKSITGSSKVGDTYIVDGVYTLSAGLKKIGTGAFVSVGVGDVYVLAIPAPICEVDAFNSATYCSNNSYTKPGEGVGITREGYNNNAGMAVLHYPANAPLEDRKKYTDITRDYSITDRDGRFDGNGKTIMWPNQEEFNRAYTQGRGGYLWKAWSTVRGVNYDIAYHEYKTGQTVEQAQVIVDGLYTANTSNIDRINEIFYDADGKDCQNKTIPTIEAGTGGNLFAEDYRGWHEFVLTEAAGDGSQKFAFDWIVDNNWWTICVPFDMTLGDLREVFGHKHKDNDGTEFAGEEHFPIVSQLTKVVRSEGGGKITEEGTEFTVGAHTVLLYFCDDLVQKAMKTNNIQIPKLGTDGYPIRENGVIQTIKGTEDERNKQVVIQAGQPYLIKPYMLLDNEGTPAETAIMTMSSKVDPKFFEFEERKKNLYFGQRDIQVYDLEYTDAEKTVSNLTPSTKYTYTFSGCYSGWYYPTYSFFLGIVPGNETEVAFKRLTTAPRTTGKRSWRSYSAVILVNWGVSGGETLEGKTLEDREEARPVKTDAFASGGTTHWVMWEDDKDKVTSSVCTDDRWLSGSTAKNNIIVSFGDFNVDSNNPAKIDGVEIGSDNNVTIVTRQKVYNLNGQLVSKGGDLKNLPRGCYIVNGKKYVVK